MNKKKNVKMFILVIENDNEYVLLIVLCVYVVLIY